MFCAGVLRALALWGALGVALLALSPAGALPAANAIPVETPDVLGFTEAGMVALPPMLELLGAKSETNAKTGAITVTRAGKSFAFTLAKTAATANRKAVKLAMAPSKIGEVIYLPVHSLVEALGGACTLKGDTMQVTLPGLASPLALPFVKVLDYTEDTPTPLAIDDCRDCWNQLYVMNADGSDARRLTYTFLGNALPAFSADGSKWVITRPYIFLPFGHIVTRTAAGAQNAVLRQTDLVNASVVYMQGAVSPDGSTVYYVEIKPLAEEVQICRMPFAGGTAEALVEGISPSLSPDGKTIAYTGSNGGEVAEFVMLMDADGKNPRALGKGSDPIFSPDGRAVAFYRTYAAEEEAPAVLATCLLGEGEPTIHEAPEAERAHAEETPVFTRDGKQIIFAREGQGIFATSLDRKKTVRLTDDESDTCPVPAPDGKQIYFLRGNDLYRMPFPGEDTTPVPVIRDRSITRFTFSPDGKLIFFLVQPQPLFDLHN